MKEPNKKTDILLIEDNSDDIYLIGIALKELNINHSLKVINNGKVALDFLINQKKNNNFLPDLILLDINLPMINGLDVLKKIKINKNTSNIPTVIFTSSDSALDVNYSYRTGADLFVRKPNNINNLKEINKYINEYCLRS